MVTLKMVISVRILTLIKLRLRKKQNFFFVKTNKNSFLLLNYLVKRNIICYYVNYKRLRSYRVYKIKLSKISFQKEKILIKLISDLNKFKLKR